MSTSARNIELKEKYHSLKQLKEYLDRKGGFDLYYDFEDLSAAAERWAKNMFDYLTDDERKDYFQSNGLELNEYHIDMVRYENAIWVEDLDSNGTQRADYVTISWYEAYIDSGVPYEDYFKGVVVDW